MAATAVRRVFVEDERRDGRFLRMTWHAERRTFVVSTWEGSVCVGATRVPVQDAPALIEVLAGGLADAAAAPPHPAPAGRRTLRQHLQAWWHDRRSPARPVLAAAEVDDRRCA
jgi:hypothetical protein